jgi:hypothetical protein
MHVFYQFPKALAFGLMRCRERLSENALSVQLQNSSATAILKGAPTCNFISRVKHNGF